jgi:hypothetical protein
LVLKRRVNQPINNEIEEGIREEEGGRRRDDRRRSDIELAEREKDVKKRSYLHVF